MNEVFEKELPIDAAQPRPPIPSLYTHGYEANPDMGVSGTALSQTPSSLRLARRSRMASHLVQRSRHLIAVMNSGIVVLMLNEKAASVA
jgi:hypothetical protein